MESLPRAFVKNQDMQPQSPTSAYKPGAFEARGLSVPVAAPAKEPKKWFSFGKSKSKCASVPAGLRLCNAS